MRFVTKLLSHPLPANLIFWGYNILFILVVAFNLLRVAFSPWRPSLHDLLTLGGSMPTSVVILLYTVILTPFAASILMAFSKLRHQPAALWKILFGVEIPIMGLALVRVIFFRQLTPATTILLGSIALSILGVFLHTFFPDLKSKVIQSLCLLSQQAAILIAGYTAMLAFFFLPIIAAFFINYFSRFGLSNLIESLFRSFQYMDLGSFVTMLLMMSLFSLTAGLFMLCPFIAVIVFWKTARSLAQRLTESNGLQFTRILRYGFSGVFVLVVALLAWQGKTNDYLWQLQHYRSATTFEERNKIATELVQKDNSIKQDLLTKYLAPYRYFSDQKTNIVEQGYHNELKTNEPTAKTIQTVFNAIAFPFIYQGRFDEEVNESAKIYQELFDNSIQEGEGERIVASLAQTNTQDELKSGLLDRYRHNVNVVARTTNVDTYQNGLLAQVAIEEEYENTTNQAQEAYYEFSLPEDSVITELKLGPDLEFSQAGADRVGEKASSANQPTPAATSVTPPQPAQVNSGQVAPSGAANQVYEMQYIRRIDPALLEQVGPRQYRLRIYPIPTKNTRDMFTNVQPSTKNQRMRFSYVTLRTSSDSILPVISQSRNLGLDKTQQHVILNNKTSSLEDIAQMPSLASESTCNTQPLTIMTGVGTISFVPFAKRSEYQPHVSCDTTSSDTIMNEIQNQKFAVLVDSSYSNRENFLDDYLDKFPLETVVAHNQVDLYFFNTRLSQPVHLTPQTVQAPYSAVAFGPTNRLQALESLPDSYDAIFMLTDSNASDSYDDKLPAALTTPSHANLYIIHPHEKIPYYDQKLTTYVLAHKGKVVISGLEALNNYWATTQFQTQTNETLIDIAPTGVWIFSPASSTASLSGPVGMDYPLLIQLAIKKLIMARAQTANPQDAATLTSLDSLNQLAQTYTVVTPYSSLIVLTTAQQQAQLDQAKKQNGRYQLTYDNGVEQLGNPSGQGLLSTSAVPEPQEWLLIIASLGMLIFFFRPQLRTLIVKR